MDQNNFDAKKLVITVSLALLVALATFFGYDLVLKPSPTPTPTPTATASPTPSPTVTATATPSPTASLSPTSTSAPATAILFADLQKPGAGLPAPVLKSSAALKLWRGETRGMILRSAPCTDKPTGAPAGVTVELFSMPVFKTLKPSAKELVVGDHFDPLLPASSICGQPGWIWADVKVSKTAAAGVYALALGDLPVSLEVQADAMPDRPTVPLYIGFQPYAAILGHKLDPNTGVGVQGPLVKQYVDLLRAHRIEPFGQTLAAPKLLNGVPNIDEWSSLNASFRQLVVDGAIAPPMVLSGPFVSQSWGSPTLFAAWEALVKATPALAGAWAYVTDEPCDKVGCGNNVDVDLAGTKARALAIKSSAPSIRTMVTHAPDARLSGAIDIFVPQFELFQAGTSGVWLYGACPSHGSCANGYLGSNTGTPDLMLDQSAIHARLFPIVAAALGGKAALYYTANESYGKRDVWTDQYDFGGNGDGQLVYPGIPGERGFSTHQAVGSIRLKLLRQGMFDVERLLKTGKLGQIVQSARVWSKDHAAIDAAAGR